MIEDENDETIWLHITKTIKPLPGRARKQVAVPIPAKIKITPQSNLTRAVELKTVTPSPPPMRTIRQLKQQKIAIQRKLDLHGFTIARAHITLIDFIKTSYARELRCVEIVTGRGNAEKGTGQLRRHVPVWLREDRNISAFIVYAGENPASRGGSLLVLLRRNKSSP